MSLVVTLLFVLATTPFESTIDRAFTEFQNNNWAAAAIALDQAYSEEPSTFDANNLHYLRGRGAENQLDWIRAKQEFEKISRENPLYAQASWHAARASANLKDQTAAREIPTLQFDLSGSLKRDSNWRVL